MSMNRYLSLLSILFFFYSCRSNSTSFTPDELTIEIPTQGNTWILETDAEMDRQILQHGIKDWDLSGLTARTYFYIGRTGRIKIGIRARASSPTNIHANFEGQATDIQLKNTTLEVISVGEFDIDSPGYYYLDLVGDRNMNTSVEISNVLIGGEATQGNIYFARDDFYWARRGPSVHLTYEVPEPASDVVYFYNEINVPEGQDVLGSYFMANGFAEGYFGIQVNSENERRILFSVWSPYKTDNPEEIPEDQKITMLKKGSNVHTGEFGNEGSGGQSYRKYMWKSDINYRFLLKGEPAGDNSTDYTAYFFAPEIGEWELIASFRRPKTNTYLTRPHSFLENFRTETGNQSRMAFWTNQWVYDTNGTWHELTRARFTADATARKESRMDYAGGSDGANFFMRNCGFFTGWTEIETTINRTSLGTSPSIDFRVLP